MFHHFSFLVFVVVLLLIIVCLGDGNDGGVSMSHPTVGVAVVRLRQKVPGQLSPSYEELPVSEAISRVHIVLGIRHRSLVGLCERMPSKSFFR